MQQDGAQHWGALQWFWLGDLGWYQRRQVVLVVWHGVLGVCKGVLQCVFLLSCCGVCDVQAMSAVVLVVVSA